MQFIKKKKNKKTIQLDFSFEFPKKVSKNIENYGC